MGFEKKLNEKVIIITGAASGFGRAGAVRFAKEGAKVVLADISVEGLEETASQIREAGGETEVVFCDVSKADDVKNTVGTAVRIFGRLDGIWNNAGIQGETEYDIFHCPVDMIDRYLDIDVKGVWYGCHFAAPELVKTKGVILNTASIVATLGTFGCSTYGTAKGGVQSLTYTVAWELGRLGVRSNCISPYCVATPGTIHQGQTLLDLQKSGTVQQRLPKVEEVVNAAVFLMSDDSSAVTGFDLRVDLGAGTRTMPWNIDEFKEHNPYAASPLDESTDKGTVNKGIDGKVAIITGGGSGFGRAGAIRFAREGAKVVVADINEDGLKETVSMINSEGGEAVYIKTDIRLAADCEKMVQKAADTYGKIDIIWNNAGIQGESAYDIAHCPVDMIDRYMDVNVKGVWYGCRFAAPYLVKTRGVILNTSSIVASLGTRGCSTYGTSKGAVRNLTYVLANELGLYGVRSNCISPYCVATPGTLGLGEKFLRNLESGTALKRLPTVEEIINVALWLSGPESSGVTGFDMRIDMGAGVRSMPSDMEQFVQDNTYAD